MALTIGDNFKYYGGKPLDARLKYDTIAAMSSMSASTLYDGIIAYCLEDGKTYQWKSGNTTDPTLGKWREFESGGSQVQTDWDQTTSTEPDYIKNKPTLGTAAEKDSTNAVTQGSTDLVESGAVYSGLNGKVDKTSVGTASGVAELDATGKVPSSQLPSFVDDVVDGYLNETDGKFYEEDTYTTEIPGEAGKIYISLDTEIQYRWTGSAFSPLGGALVLGETSSTAYRGDRGKTAYDFSQNPATATPEMDGVGAAGSSGKWAREDHVHPSDTTKADNDIIAPAFDETETYAIGDRVTYNSGLYRFISSHTGAWVAGDVTEVTVDGEIPQELTSAQMQAIKDAFVVNQPVQFASNPVGCIIQMMGITAPAGYLACDGTAYNIADFPFLAAYFESQFGTKNHFGGDGTTTFAVPDLRGEFLRGTGNNGHSGQGNGASVGTHQDGTLLNYAFLNSVDGYIRGDGTDGSNFDNTKTSDGYYAPLGNANAVSSTKTMVTTRPTNTSILYCIKY